MNHQNVLAAMLVAAASLGAQAAPPSAGLIGYWEADGDATDSSSTVNHGSFSGSYAAGVRGSAFDLSDWKVAVPDNPAYALGPSFTIAFWFNNSNRGLGTAFISQDEGGGSLSKWFIDYGYAAAAFDIHVNGPWNAFLTSSPVSPPADGWAHLALVVNANSYQFYLNTSPIGSGIFPNPLPDPNAELKFGFAETGIQYDGLMDEIAIYNRSLTQNEVIQLAAAVPEPTSMALMGLGLVCLLGLTATKRRHQAREG